MSFGDDIGKFIDNTDKKLSRTFRGTALSLFSRVVLRTPVGNADLWQNPKSAPKGYTGGRLRGGWQAQINGKPTGAYNQIDKTGSSTIRKINSVVGRLDTVDTIYLMNNLPYVLMIENGQHSKQAPAGMVKISVAEFQRTVKQQVKK